MAFSTGVCTVCILRPLGGCGRRWVYTLLQSAMWPLEPAPRRLSLNHRVCGVTPAENITNKQAFFDCKASSLTHATLTKKQLLPALHNRSC
jgi:hypothetical protein